MDLGNITATLGIMAKTADANLRSKLEEVASKGSQDPTDMIDMQSAMYKYTLSLDSQSTAVKVWADACKGVISKSA